MTVIPCLVLYLKGKNNYNTSWSLGLAWVVSRFHIIGKISFCVNDNPSRDRREKWKKWIKYPDFCQVSSVLQISDLGARELGIERVGGWTLRDECQRGGMALGGKLSLRDGQCLQPLGDQVPYVNDTWGRRKGTRNPWVTQGPAALHISGSRPRTQKVKTMGQKPSWLHVSRTPRAWEGKGTPLHRDPLVKIFLWWILVHGNGWSTRRSSLGANNVTKLCQLQKIGTWGQEVGYSFHGTESMSIISIILPLLFVDPQLKHPSLH